jgi:hypothetical protein
VIKTVRDLARLLSRYSYRFSTEADLQGGVESVLEKNGVAFEREKILTPADRPDFMVAALAIEVKIGGSVSALLRQCSRYLQLDAVDGLLIVAGGSRLATQIPTELCGKPVAVLNVRACL